MGEISTSLGVWLASDSANLCVGTDTLNVLVVNCKSTKEIVDMLGPLSKRLLGGVTTWSKGISSSSDSSESSSKIKFKKLEDSAWNVVVFSPISIETAGTKGLRSEILHALTLVKLSERSRVILCVPSSAETSPIALRVRV